MEEERGGGGQGGHAYELVGVSSGTAPPIAKAADKLTRASRTFQNLHHYVRVVKVSDFIRVFGFMFFLALTRTDFTLQTRAHLRILRDAARGGADRGVNFQASPARARTNN